MRRPRGTLACLWAAAYLWGCGAGPAVERTRAGNVEIGRRIPAAAYAWYGRAVQLESQGQLDSARQAYREVLNLDPQSGAAWAGLATTYCETERLHAERVFEEGLEQAAELAPLYLARAECALAWRKPERAVPDAREALRRDPWSTRASLVAATALELSGEPEAAARIRRGMLLFTGVDSPVSSIPSFEVRASEPEGSESAGRTGPEGERQEALLHALAQGDLEAARRASPDVLPGELASLALLLGRAGLAERQARLVLAADPDNADAWIVLLVVAPEHLWSSHLQTASDPSVGEGSPIWTDASPAGRCLLHRHLERLAVSATIDLYCPADFGFSGGRQNEPALPSVLVF